ncbi:hypothetical protein [Spiroplasma endosymbiont of Polydrusus pterygomalis]
MAKGKIKGSKDHSFEFKEKIVNEYSINNKSYSEIAKGIDCTPFSKY